MAENLTDKIDLRPAGKVEFSVEDDGRSVATVTRFFMKIDPATFERMADSYLAAAVKLTTLKDTLMSQAVVMAQVWEGTSSVESQQSLRTLHATARELAEKFRAVGQQLQALGKRLRQHQDFVQDKSGSWSTNNYATWDDSIPGYYRTMNGGWDWGSRDELAGQHLRLLNNDLLGIYEQLPATVRKAIPALNPDALPGPELTFDPEQDDYHIDPNLFKPPGGDLQGPGLDGTGTPPSVESDLPNLPDGTSPDLAYPDGDADSSGAGTDGEVPGSTNPTGGMPGDGNLNDGNPSTPGMGTTKSGIPDQDLTTNAGIPDTSGVQPSAGGTMLEDFQRPAGWDPGNHASTPNGSHPYAAPTGPGTGGNLMTGSGTGPLNARPASAVSGGMPFMPMAGAGTAAGETEEREKNTWLLEDDDVWGGDTDDAVSERIG
ncbi:hypothetical protein FXF51_21980 [Nonomuraea sp. PA05]|uniref:WXG100 family type VII secretion target n=1 Tax=Nonomuraea sp. PA05 TaxID=2604466 RepID=UPI0011D4F323|nr:WXG100 family type VII secretion target [Nonomuraea sp. PA05]TYB64384.1 hypothetical protein FXF51_21980 [Nonomuraea sp. PA05]